MLLYIMLLICNISLSINACHPSQRNLQSNLAKINTGSSAGTVSRSTIHLTDIQRRLLNAVNSGNVQEMCEAITVWNVSPESIGQSLDFYNENRQTPLDIAFSKKYSIIAAVLMGYGANFSPEQYCRYYNFGVISASTNFVTIMLNFRIILKSNIDQANNLARAAQSTINTALVIAQQQSLSLDVNQLDNRGQTLLAIAVRANSELLVRIILGMGVDCNIKDTLGISPLMIAARYGYSNLVDILIQAGANVFDCDNNKWTAFAFAVQHGHQECVQKLSAKMQVGLAGQSSRTPVGASGSNSSTSRSSSSTQGPVTQRNPIAAVLKIAAGVIGGSANVANSGAAGAVNTASSRAPLAGHPGNLQQSISSKPR